MRRLPKEYAGWAVLLWSPLVPLLLSTACATSPSARKYVGPVSDSRASAQAEESFPALWEKWSVHLGAAARGEKPWLVSMPFSMAGGRRYGGRSSGFPLQIAATLMDSLLIETGLQHYAAILTMTAEEQAAFRNAYFQRYDPAEHVLIWCSLRTRAAESYLDRARWVIFLEDDAGNQFEPVKIWEETQPMSERAREALEKYSSQPGLRGWQIHVKDLMLCFPRRDFYGHTIRSESTRSLKLVFQLVDDENTRAEGSWVFQEAD